MAAACVLVLGLSAASCAAKERDFGAGGGGAGGATGSTSSSSSSLCLADHACADPPPPGWNGPVALYYGDDPNFVCPASYGMPILAGGLGPMGAPVSCTPCTCDNQACGPLQIKLWLDVMCVFGANVQSLPVAPGCFGFSAAAAGSVQIPKVPTLPGKMCNAGGGIPAAPQPAGFTKHVTLCGPTQGGGPGCTAGSCLPRPPVPLDARFCIYQTGALACPAGYMNAVEFGTGIDDTRGCSPCSCDAPGPVCNVSVGLFSAGACQGGPSGVFPDDGACHSVNGGADFKSVDIKPVSPCTPSQTGPIGGVATQDPTTVCCR